MKEKREILKLVSEKFVQIIGLDWFGFSIKILDLYDELSFFLYRENENSGKNDIIYFVYGWEVDSKNRTNLYLNKNHFQSSVLFKNISEILHFVLGKPSYEESLYGSFLGEFGKTVTNFPEFTKNLRWMAREENDLMLLENGEVHEENLKVVADSIYQYLMNWHLPFFDRVSSLQVVNDEIINKVTKEEYGNYIPGRFMNAKVLIIMKLCNNPRYVEFRDWALGAYGKGAEMNPDRYLEDFKIIKSLTEYLDSGNYKELL